MREPYTQLYLHLVWSTWNRLPLITPDIRSNIYACIQEECRKMNVQFISIGGTDDHVHLLVRISPTTCISTLVKQVKGSSSHLVNKVLKSDMGFKWQGAYGAFTVSKSIIPKLILYIKNQEEHHNSGITNKDMEISWVNGQGE